MSMFCYQCQETAGGRGCAIRGVCGKTEDIARLQDLLIHTLRGISEIVVKSGADASKLSTLNGELLNSLFMTITNANFDGASLEAQIDRMLGLRDMLREQANVPGLSDAAAFHAESSEQKQEMAASVGVLRTENEDIRSLREMITYGLKGMAAYAEHARNLGKEDPEIYAFMYKALAATLDDGLGADELVKLTLETGANGVKVMALLDAANTSRYGNPEITMVDIGVRKNPAITNTVKGMDTAMYNSTRPNRLSSRLMR